MFCALGLRIGGCCGELRDLYSMSVDVVCGV